MNRASLAEFNLEACYPLTASTVMYGYDNDSYWSQAGWDVDGFGGNSL